MGEVIPIYKEKNDRGIREIFYVPHYEVEIGKTKLSQEVTYDVRQVTYSDKIDEIDSFELVVNNWDAHRNKFKYEPASQPAFEELFEVGKELTLKMGYVNNLRVMLKGIITTLEPLYPPSGMPTLTVRGLNILHRFRKKQHTWSWDNKRDSEIAKEIGNNPESNDKPGLGVKVKVDDNFAKKEMPEVFVFMNNRYDILFLLERARVHGYSVYLDEGEDQEEFIYFGPSDRLRDVTYELEWGKTLSKFQPTLTTAKQVEQVTVRGWNRRTKEPIEGTAKIGDADVDINQDLHAVAEAAKGRHEVVTSEPIHTPQKANERAKAILRRTLQDIVKATGTTVGLPDLRAGRRVHVKGLSPRFDGEYFITETTHSIGSGYRTDFSARREKGLS